MKICQLEIEDENEWKGVLITPVFKGEDNDLICNYDPISILPVPSKVLEKSVATYS